MQKIKDIIEYAMSSNPTLEDLRELVRDTEELSPDTKIKFERHEGQRDSETFSIIVVRGGIV